MVEAAVTSAVKDGILPVPLLAKPVAVLLFVQLNVSLLLPLKAMVLTGKFSQTVIFETLATVPLGFTVIVNVCGVPEQPFITGVTVMVDISVVATVADVKEAISPVPLAASPVAVLSFVQLNVAPDVPTKAMLLTEPPVQTAISVGSLTTGLMMVIVKDWLIPVHVPSVGVTLIVATCCVPTLLAVNAAIFPVPLAINPMLGLSFVQL